MPGSMVTGMATKKYTVTLPEELPEEIRSVVGPGAFSAYVTRVSASATGWGRWWGSWRVSTAR